MKSNGPTHMTMHLWGEPMPGAKIRRGDWVLCMGLFHRDDGWERADGLIGQRVDEFGRVRWCGCEWQVLRLKRGKS